LKEAIKAYSDSNGSLFVTVLQLSRERMKIASVETSLAGFQER